MVAQRIPLAGLSFGEKESLYVGFLERRVAQAVVTEAKFRVLLEVLTGDQWDDENINLTEEMLRDLATTNIHRRMAISLEQAARLADERIAAINAKTVPEPFNGVN